jgi:hypothetical protein
MVPTVPAATQSLTFWILVRRTRATHTVAAETLEAAL